MTSTIMGITLWIAVLTVSVSVGANVFQMMVVDPEWSASPPQSIQDFTSRTSFAPRMKRFHTNPVYIVGLLCILASTILGWHTQIKYWALASLIFYSIVIAGTLLYVWKLNEVIFTKRAACISPSTVIKSTNAWIVADRIRLAFKIASFVCLLRAFMMYAKT